MLTKEQKNELREIYTRDVWGKDTRMVDYCMGQALEIAYINKGAVVVEKKPIQKDFCFGYSHSAYDTESYDEANRLAAEARRSEEHFRRENRPYDDDIKKLENALEGFRDEKLPDLIPVVGIWYMGQPADSPLRAIRYMRAGAVLECTGPAFVRELPGIEFDFYDAHLRILTENELRSILAAYRRAAEYHEKRVNAYLKKYGTSKVRSWSYWQDE